MSQMNKYFEQRGYPLVSANIDRAQEARNALRGERVGPGWQVQEPLRSLLNEPGVLVEQAGTVEGESWETCYPLYRVVALPVQPTAALREAIAAAG